MIPEEAMPNFHNRSHSITAHAEVVDGDEGVLLAVGNLQGGFTFFVADGRLHYVHNLVGMQWQRVDADDPIGAGAHHLVFRFIKTAEHAGRVELLVDDRVVGGGEIPRFTPVRFNLVGAGLWCGRDPGLPVCDDYPAPFSFTGTLHRVTVDLDGDEYRDPNTEADIAIARQ